jgi:hypothetical protein
MTQPNLKALQAQLTLYRWLSQTVTTAAPQLMASDASSLNDILNARIHFLEVSNLFGGILTEEHSGWVDRFIIGDFVSLSRFGAGSTNQTASLDSKKQPKEGWYLYFQFSTGAYLLNREYMPEVFEEFWGELLALRPAYSGRLNKELLFTPEQAYEVYEAYKDILVKYRTIAEQRKVAVKRERLQKQLAELG